MENFSKSAITFTSGSATGSATGSAGGSVRLSHKEIDTKREANHFIEKRNVVICNTVCYTNNIEVYKLKSTFVLVDEDRFSKYPDSYDFYAFMISMMKNPTFSTLALQNEKMTQLWNDMWIFNVEDFDTTHIKNKWLRSDIVDHAWNLLTA